MLQPSSDVHDAFQSPHAPISIYMFSFHVLRECKIYSPPSITRHCRNLSQPQKRTPCGTTRAPAYYYFMRLMHPRFLCIVATNENGIILSDISEVLTNLLLTLIHGRHFWNEDSAAEDWGRLRRNFRCAVGGLLYHMAYCALTSWARAVRGAKGEWEINTVIVDCFQVISSLPFTPQFL